MFAPAQKNEMDQNKTITNYLILEDAARNFYAGVVWSHKIQEKQADIYASRFSCLKLLNIITSSLATAGIISTIFIDPFWVKLVSAIISFISLCISAYLKFFDLQRLATSHKSTANKLIFIRDRFRFLITEIKIQDESVQNLKDKFEQLIKDTNNIYQDAPNTTDAAVKEAKKALQIKHDNSFTDDEIDSYLPALLRKTSHDK